MDMATVRVIHHSIDKTEGELIIYTNIKHVLTKYNMNFVDNRDNILSNANIDKYHLFQIRSDIILSFL